MKKLFYFFLLLLLVIQVKAIDFNIDFTKYQVDNTFLYTDYNSEFYNFSINRTYTNNAGTQESFGQYSGWSTETVPTYDDINSNHKKIVNDGFLTKFAIYGHSDGVDTTYSNGYATLNNTGKIGIFADAWTIDSGSSNRISYDFWLNDSYFIEDTSKEIYIYMKEHDDSTASTADTQIYFLQDSQFNCYNQIIGDGIFNTTIEMNFTSNQYYALKNLGCQFNRIIIESEQGDGGDYQFYNLSIPNISLYVENELPTFNVTYDKRVCLNTTTGSVNVNINITANDAEGDQIIYGYTPYKYNVNPTYVTYTRSYFFINDGFVRNVLRGGKYCEVNTQRGYIGSKHNVIQDWHYTEWFNLPDYAEMWLEINPLCDANSTEYIYQFDKVLRNPQYKTTVKALPTESFTMDITLYDQTLIPKLNLTLVKEADGNITLYKNTTKIGSNVSGYNFEFYIQSFNTNNGTIITINGTNYFIAEMFGPSAYIGLKSNFTIFQKNFYYWDEYDYWYNSGKLVSIEYINPGTYPIGIYVTDKWHNNSQYNVKYISIEVLDNCVYLGQEIGTFENDFNIFELADRTFGGSLRNLVNSIGGGNEKMRTLIWWTWIVVFIGIIISLFITTQRLLIIVPLILSSSFCWLLSYLLHYTSHQITFLIIIALGLAGPMARLYQGYHNG